MGAGHTRFEKQHIVICFQVTQAGYIFGGLKILHLRVCERGEYQQIGVIPFFHIVVRQVRFHVIVLGLIGGIAPFGVLAGGQRDAWVAHGGYHVDKRYASNNSFVKVRTHIGHGPHEQSSGGAAFGKQAVGGGIFFFHQKVRAIDKVVECVDFMQHFTVFIPFVAHFHATTNVGNSDYEATIEQTDFIAIEAWIVAKTIGTIGREVARCGAITGQSFLVHERDGHFYAIMGNGPHEFGFIIVAVEVAEHRSHFFYLLGFRFHIVIHDRCGGFHGRKGITQGFSVKFGVVVHRTSVSRFAHFDIVVCFVGPSDYVDLAEATFVF